MLTTRYLNGIPERSRASQGTLDPLLISAELVARLQSLHRIADGRGQSLAQLALSWALRDPRVTSVLIGASSVHQLEDRLAAVAGPELTNEELRGIDDINAEVLLPDQTPVG